MRSTAPRARRALGVRLALAALGGVAGALLFWAIQLGSGGGTITAFMGAQIVDAGGYPVGLAPLVGWLVHLGVALAYAVLFGSIVGVLPAMAPVAEAAITFPIAVGLGSLTTLIAPPAISVTIGLLGAGTWPDALYPLNTELGLPFWNHVAFFALNWLIQVVTPALVRGT